MSVLVTGGAGFIGARVCARIVKHGVDAVAADLLPGQRTVPGASVVRLDIVHLHEVLRVLRAHPEIDIVIHMAAVLGEATEDPYAAVRINEIGLINVLEAARLEGVRRVVYASSISVYGGDIRVFGDRPVTEDDYCPPGALGTYGLTKLHNEHMARKYASKHGLEAVGLRINGVFGPDRWSGVGRWLADFVSLPATGRPAHIPQPADVRWPLIYADDAAEAFARLALAPQLEHAIYNSGGFSSSTAELAGAVAEAIPGAVVTHEPPGSGGLGVSAGGAQAVNVANVDGSRLTRELAWQPGGLAAGIAAHAAEARRTTAVG